MDTLKPNFWNKRFGTDEYIYGDEPNEYLKAKLAEIKQGNILFPCDGEGRNSVYAAEKGWYVDSFDMSSSGRKKTMQLALRKGVSLNYSVCMLEDFDSSKKYDAMALVYAHFEESKRRDYHQKLSSYLKPGSFLILEAFSKSHIKFQQENPTAGGPKIESMLYDLDEVKNDFKGFDFIDAVETETLLSEGNYHKGKAMVVRIFAKKF